MDTENNTDQQPNIPATDQSINPSDSGMAEQSNLKPKSTKVPWMWIGIVGLIIAFLAVLFYSLQAAQTELEKTNLTEKGPITQAIIEKGSIIIGTDATYPPMEYLDSSENMIGYDVDLGKRIAEELGVTAEFKNIAWDDLFTSLKNSEVDIIISAVTITQERKDEYDFSIPYINAGQVIITQISNTEISTTNDLSGKKIAVQEGTTNEEEALKHTSEDLVIKYKSFEEAAQSLVNGESDAIFSDLTNAKGIVDENPTLIIASDPFTSDFYGIVFRKGSTDIVIEVNEIIDTIRQRGVLTSLKQKWLE